MRTMVHERSGRDVGHPVPRSAIVEASFHQRLRLIHDLEVVGYDACLGWRDSSEYTVFDFPQLVRYVFLHMYCIQV